MDRVSSPRYPNDRMTQGIQVAVDDFIQDRYDNIKEAEKQYAFETIQRLRSELRTIIFTSTQVPNAQGEITLPADYRYDVGLEVIIDGITRNSKPASISETLGTYNNSHTRPNDQSPFHNERVNTITIKHGKLGTLSSATLYYIVQHTPPFIGLPEDNTTTLLIGSTYFVESGSIIYNGVTYNLGDSFVVVAGFTTFLGAGTVVRTLPLPLPDTSHEEIAKRTAQILTGVVENYNKTQLKAQEVQAN